MDKSIADKALEKFAELIDTFGIEVTFIKINKSIDSRKPRESLTETIETTVVKKVIIQTVNERGELTPFGIGNLSSVALSLLPKDYEDIKDAKFVEISGIRYNIEIIFPVPGLGLDPREYIVNVTRA